MADSTGTTPSKGESDEASKQHRLLEKLNEEAQDNLKMTPDKSEFDEGIKIIGSFRDIKKRISFHDQEVVEVDVIDLDEQDDKYIDMPQEQMEEWLKLRQKIQHDK